MAHVCRITFAIAEACLIAGATKNAYHTKYRDMVYAGNWTCQSLRKGVFIAGAVFVVFTMILNVYFYMYYSKATSQAAKRISNTTPSVGMSAYA
jgi:F0F1-type ATP synthase membrane subunit b/b'